MTILGLDIGGANIKAADSSGQSSSHRFALWKHPNELRHFLASEVLSRFDSCRAVALTMTGELCDCFENKRQGVRFIAEAVNAVVGTMEFVIYSVEGKFLTFEQCTEEYLSLAASNWHALANYVRRFLTTNEFGILMDIGSTSCDVIPINSREVLALGATDTTRIQNQELIYTGTYRTPVCAVANTIEFHGEEICLAQEIFATMADVYLIAGDLPPDDQNCDTADGRPFTWDNSLRRLARMICADVDEVSNQDIKDIAERVRDRQQSLIQNAYLQVADNRQVDVLISSGSGQFAIDRIEGSQSVRRQIKLEEELGSELCVSAPAFAVAKLLEDSR